MKLLAAAFVPMLFATVFDDCGNLNSSPMRPPTPVMPDKPCCLTDPPEGCAAYCASVGNVQFTDACNGIGAGPRTQQFQATVGNELIQLAMQGTPVCADSVMDGLMGDGQMGTTVVGDSVTPCFFGIPPVEWPNQDHNVCAPMTPGVCVTSW